MLKIQMAFVTLFHTFHIYWLIYSSQRLYRLSWEVRHKLGKLLATDDKVDRWQGLCLRSSSIGNWAVLHLDGETRDRASAPGDSGHRACDRVEPSGTLSLRPCG